MKLVSLFCLAALSLAGCAGDVAYGGGQGEGLKPSKIAFTPPPAEGDKPFDPRDVVTLQQITFGAPADIVCDGCEFTAYKVAANDYGIDSVKLVSDGGMPVCNIFLDKLGGIIVDECGLSRN